MPSGVQKRNSGELTGEAKSRGAGSFFSRSRMKGVSLVLVQPSVCGARVVKVLKEDASLVLGGSEKKRMQRN